MNRFILIVTRKHANGTHNQERHNADGIDQAQAKLDAFRRRADVKSVEVYCSIHRHERVQA